jgi:hypothetical protein
VAFAYTQIYPMSSKIFSWFSWFSWFWNMNAVYLMGSEFMARDQNIGNFLLVRELGNFSGDFVRFLKKKFPKENLIK